jgi:hypothetical protein
MDNASDVQTELDHSKAVVTLGIQMYRLDSIYLNFVFSFLDETKNFKFKYIKSFSFPKSKPSTLIILKIKMRVIIKDLVIVIL